MFTTVIMNGGRFFETIEEARENVKRMFELDPRLTEIMIVSGPVEVIYRPGQIHGDCGGGVYGNHNDAGSHDDVHYDNSKFIKQAHNDVPSAS